jgi:Ser/Thr protein kinase RdoA (MazF antagonist)
MKAGDKFHVGETEHTLGNKFGSTGSTGSVHHVEGQPGVVAKVFHKDGGVSPADRKKEEANLKAVGEHHGSAETDGGHHIILATKKTGTHITNTNAWKNAGTDAEKKTVLDKAKQLTEERNTHHANTHGVVHTDTHHGNVLFHENDNGLHSAHFVDWGNAKAAEKDKKGALTQKTKDIITRGGKKVVHGVSRR